MKAIFYSRVQLRRLGIQDLVASYTNWMLGLDGSRKTRSRRLEAGVPASLSSDAVAAGGSFKGAHDCLINTRCGDGLLLLRFTHRDADDGGILWHTAVRVQLADVGCLLEHAVGRSAPRRTVLTPAAASPRVFVAAVDRNGPDIDPRDLCDTSVLGLPPDDVEGFVKHMLLDEERRLPYLIVSPTNDQGTPLLEPADLAERLAGMARLVYLTEKAAAFRLAAELRRRGFTNDFGFSNGALRLFHPGLQPSQGPFQHYLWLRARVESYGDALVDRVAGEAAARIVERTLPIGFFDLVETFDRRERQRTAQQLLEVSVTVPQVSAQRDVLERVLAERDVRITALVGSLESGQRDLAELLSQREALEGKLREAEERNIELQLEAEEREAKLRYERDEQAQRLRDLSGLLETLKAGKAAAGVTQHVREAIEAVIRGEPSLEQSLSIVQALYPERLIVLPEAWKTSRASRNFHRKRDAFDLLHKLATRYWEALQQGGGDAQARAIFGNSYAARESEVVGSNKKARQARTFNYEGEPVLMLKHLKIGTKDSLSETLRIHFEWMAKDRRVVIGHCGGHLPFL